MTERAQSPLPSNEVLPIKNKNSILLDLAELIHQVYVIDEVTPGRYDASVDWIGLGFSPDRGVRTAKMST
jgi:hypothetical protein